jgi:ribonuclease G
MQKSENRKQLQNKMKEFMKNDRAKHHILPPSKFGLIQITRRRVRPEMSIKTTETIPNEEGAEKEVRATILLIDDIERDLKKIMTKNGNKKVSLYAHPFIEAYLKRGLKSFQRKWFIQYKKWIAIEGLDSLPLVEYHFYDEKGGELEA